MTAQFSHTEWAVILGGSSGFGLATAHKLSVHGMSLCVVHRDRRGSMARIDEEFAQIRSRGTKLLTFNADALDRRIRATVLDGLREAMGAAGRVRVLLHSIAFGNLKLIAPDASCARDDLSSLAAELAIEPQRLAQTIDRLFAGGLDALHTLASPPAYPSASFLDEEDLMLTIHSMGTSLLGWTQEILRRGLFGADARVFGLTSEGNELAWKGYAAVAAAKVALESVARSIAVEMAHRGIRCNVIQPGVTDTPALRLIPGAEQLKSHARLRNPFRRLTTPQDVANAIFLLSTDEAAWINGEVIRVDGGEHVSGLSR
jgi:NAD(P)-dependent dehydrogenase (short-subunit alcohol dehydrogenase family)